MGHVTACSADAITHRPGVSWRSNRCGGYRGGVVEFFLGTHQVNWLATSPVPLFVSHRRLSLRSALPRARAQWALDSGGFSELSLFGKWRTTASRVHATRCVATSRRSAISHGLPCGGCANRGSPRRRGSRCSSISAEPSRVCSNYEALGCLRSQCSRDGARAITTTAWRCTRTLD